MTEAEQIQELLKPRILVTDKWPGMECKVGDIINLPSPDWMYGNWRRSSKGYCDANYFSAWPNLFRLLAWWEKREEGEMKAIEYIRWNEHQIKFNGEDKNEVMKVESVRICNPGGSMAGMFEFVVERTIPGKENNKYNYPQLFIPATLSDYNQFINLSKEK